MKLREVTPEDVMQFCRIDEADEQLVPVIMAAARSYILGYTGLAAQEIDAHEDITAAFLVLCCEMYDNRNFTVETDKVNPYAQSVLAMHARNYL